MRSAAGWLAAHELWLVAAAAPFLLIPGCWTPFAAALLSLTWLCRLAARGKLSVATPADAPLAGLLVMSGVGLAASVDVRTSLVAFWRLALGVALYYALANGVSDRRSLRTLTLLLAAGGVGLVALTLLATRWDLVRLMNLPTIYDRLPVLLTDPEDGLGIHPRVMGMALATVLPVLVSVALFGCDRLLRGAAGLAALFMVLILPFTQTPGALLGAAVALALLAVWRSRWFLLALLPAAGLAWWELARVDLKALALRMVSIQDPLGIAVALRLDMWGRALAMIREMPFTGIGSNSFPAIQTNFYPGYLIGPEVHSHNVFLQVALDLGLPGLLAFLGLFGAAVVMAIRARRLRPGRDETALIMGLLAGLLSYLIANQIDTLWQPKFGVLLWLLLGLLAAVYGVARGQGTPVRPAPSVRWIAAAWVLPPLLLGLVLVLLPGARERNVGALLAQKAIYTARTTGQVDAEALAVAAAHLQRAVDLRAGSSHVLGLLGSIRSWQRDDTAATAAALDAFRQQVALDLVDPTAEYMPFEALRRAISGEPGPGAAADLLAVYGQWMARFPDRAEPYVWAAIVHVEHWGDRARAAAFLRAALDRNAQPAAILQVALRQLGQ